MQIPDDALLNWSPTDAGEARALIDIVQKRAHEAQVDLAEPPPQPTSCCGRGCIGCVWEGYYTALAWWRDESVGRWSAGGP